MMEDRMDLPETGADFVREGSREASRQDEGRQAEGQGAPDLGGQHPSEAQPGGEGGQPGHQEMIPHARFHAVNEELRGYKDRFGALESRYNERERLLEAQAQHLNQVLGLLQQGQRGQPQAQPQQPAAPPPDFWDNPQAATMHAFKQGFQPFEERYGKDREAFEEQRRADFENHVAVSRALAAVQFGDEVTQQAEAWLDSTLKANPGMRPVFQQMIFGPGKLPGVEMVKMYQGQSPLGQPQGMQALVEAEVTRRLAAMGQQVPQAQAAPPQAQPAAPPQMPSSFAAARNGAPRGAPQASGPRSLSEIMGR